jgi:hypothetical protein
MTAPLMVTPPPFDASAQAIAQGWSPGAAPPTRLRGVWIKPSMTLADIQAFEAATGKTTNAVLAFTDGSTWSSIQSSPAGWARAWAPSGKQLILTYPMLPGKPYYAPSHNQPGFAELIAGQHDAVHTAALTALAAVNATGANTILRIGHEYNLNDAPWAASNGAGGIQPNFGLALEHLIDLAKTIPGNHWRYATFNPSCGDQGVGDPSVNAYPGDSRCDFIGPDAYCTSPPGPPNNTGGFLGEPAAWNRILNGTYGLNWHIAFAKAHGKPMLIPEWGLWKPASAGTWPQGGGDDPTYMGGMLGTMAANGMGESLWTNDYDLLGAPMSLAVYQAGA